MLECSFFIPIKRDAILTDGGEHETEMWERLDRELLEKFQGRTIAPDLYRGVYKDPDTGERVDDESYRFIVALPKEKIDDLRSLLRNACTWFAQKCIYLSVAGNVEFIGPESHDKK